MTDLVSLEFPPELLTFAIIVGGLLFLVGARRVGLRLIMMTIATMFAVAIFGPAFAKIGIPNGVPIWVNIGIALVIGLLILQALIRFVFGSSVANQTVGNILSSFIIAVATMGAAPFRWLQRALRMIRGELPRD